MSASPESRLPNPGSSVRSRRVAVVGGGISGLAAAFRLRQLDASAEVTVFEASDRVGGSLHTEHREGFLLEHGADNFITNLPWGVDLCKRLGIDETLISTRPEGRRVFIVRNGRLHPVPEGFMVMAPGKLSPLLTTPLLSLRGKLRLLAEAIVPRRKGGGDESLASFATRRLGREAFERIVQPLVAGIYTADAEQLSLAATLPRFLDMERDHGSLIRAALRQRRASPSDGSGARYSLFVAPRDGMSTIVDALVEKIGAQNLRLKTSVERIERRADGGWRIVGNGEWGMGSGEGQEQHFEAVVMAAPGPRAARMLEEAAPELSKELRGIACVGSAVVMVGYRSEQLPKPLEGFGFVVPEVEKREILAVSYSSQKYEGRAPAGHVLLRVFLGGAGRPMQYGASDDELRSIVTRELGELLQVRGEPVLFEVARWPTAMPQYHVGHLERVARIESMVEKLPTLALAGNAYRGVGVPQCIASGEAAAEKVIEALQNTSQATR